MPIRIRASDERELRPVRWPGPPRRSTVLRAMLVAALLTLAGGLLHLGRPGTDCAGPVDRTPRSTRAAVPAPTTGAPGGGSARETTTAVDGPAAVTTDGTGTGATGAGTGQPILPAGTVGVAIRLAEPAALAVVRPGTRVDLLAVPPADGKSGQPVLLAGRVLVLGVTGADETAALYLALAPDVARRAVSVPGETRFAIMVRS